MSRQREHSTVGFLLDWTIVHEHRPGHQKGVLGRQATGEYQGINLDLGEGFLDLCFSTAFNDTHLCIAIDTMRERDTLYAKRPEVM